MDLRLDPHASALMAGELAADHAAYLRGRVGREPTAGELYVAHVLGRRSGPAKLIDAVRISPTASAPALFPDAAASNRGIFYRAGRAATVTEVYANLTAGPGAAPAQVAPPTDNSPDQGFIQYASARRQDRLAEQQEMVNLILRGPETNDDVGLSVQTANSLFSTEMLRALSQANTGRTGRMQEAGRAAVLRHFATGACSEVVSQACRQHFPTVDAARHRVVGQRLTPIRKDRWDGRKAHSGQVDRLSMPSSCRWCSR